MYGHWTLYTLSILRVIFGLLVYSFRGNIDIISRPFFDIWLITLAVLSFFYLILLKIGRFRGDHLRRFIILQIIVDVLFAETLILLTGGIESWFFFILLILTIGASILLGRSWGYITASISGILYGLIIDLQFYQILPIPYSPSYRGSDFLYNLCINIIALYLTAFLMRYLLRRLEKTSLSLKEKEKDMEEILKFQKEVIENIPSGLITTDSTGRITLFNSSAEKITGLNFSEVRGKTIWDVFPFLPAPITPGRIEGIIKKGKNGTYIGMNLSEYNDHSDKKVGFIGTFQDLTLIKKMEEEMRRREKMAAIGELSASIAHELRNPLASIKSSLQLIKEQNTDEDTRHRLIEIVMKEINRLDNVVRDFLIYSRPSPLRKKRFLVSDVIEEIVDTLNHQFIHVRVKKDLPRLYIVADELKIKQLFWNLLKNAFEAVSPDGQIEISIRDDNNNLVFTVKDNGPGIPEKYSGDIFRPFFSTKTGGTGLGLAISYRIVEEHGGRITVDSQEGVGTTFNIFIPKGL